MRNHAWLSKLSEFDPEDLATVLSNLGPKKVGFPVWKLQKRRDGYSVNIILEKCAEKPPDTTPFSAHCEVMNKRKWHSQQCLEAFIEKKMVQKLQDSFCKVSDAGTPAGSDVAWPWCEASDLV